MKSDIWLSLIHNALFFLFYCSQNMVGPGEVDDELQEEVKEECAEKYGPVEKCVIYEVTGRVSPEEAVRIFVQFQRQSDAEKGSFSYSDFVVEQCGKGLSLVC